MGRSIASWYRRGRGCLWAMSGFALGTLARFANGIAVGAVALYFCFHLRNALNARCR